MYPPLLYANSHTLAMQKGVFYDPICNLWIINELQNRKFSISPLHHNLFPSFFCTIEKFLEKLSDAFNEVENLYSRLIAASTTFNTGNGEKNTVFHKIIKKKVCKGGIKWLPLQI